MKNDIICILKNKISGYNLFYWDEVKNAGDNFNKVLFDYFDIKYKREIARKSTLIGMGSILENIIVPKSKYVKNKIKCYYNKVNVIGCGFIEKNSEEECAIKNVYVLATRGRLSLERLKKIKNVKLDKNIVLADPGILVSYIYNFDNSDKIFDVGIIPHYIDKNSKALLNIKLENKKYTFIDIQDAPKTVCELINKCKFILSSSLHELIFADSFGVPNFHIVLSDNVAGGEYKFIDYYSGFNLNYAGNIDLRTSIIDDNKIEELENIYTAKNAQVEQKQKELIRQYERLRGSLL